MTTVIVSLVKTSRAPRDSSRKHVLLGLIASIDPNASNVRKAAKACANNHYMRRCDGHGYGTDSNDCTQCRDDASTSCTASEWFKPCSDTPWFDTSRCVVCTAIPEHATALLGGEVCDFACNPGHFHKFDGCAECKIDVLECSGCSKLSDPDECHAAYDRKL